MTTEVDDSLRNLWDRRESKAEGHTFAGIEYTTDLVSSQGVAVTLFAPENASKSAIAKAKRAAKNQRDVVTFYVVRVPDDWYAQDDFVSDGYAGGWIAAARWIVKNRQARRVLPVTGELVPEDKRGGMLLDMFSANTMVMVYDALNAANKAKFGKMDLRLAHHVAFGLAKKPTAGG